MTEHNSPYEIKFTIENTRSKQIIDWLKKSCKKDPEFPEGSISSIYYDTPKWKYLNEKINSDYLKTKIRLRWYSDLLNYRFSKDSFMEVKLKTGSKRKKIRVNTGYDGGFLDTIQMNDIILNQISLKLLSAGVLLGEAVFPTFQIRYKRIRFIDPYTLSRICFDYDIEVPKVNNHMISKQNPFPLKTAVFEIKGNVRRLPSCCKPLIGFGFKKESFSKYLMCYKKITSKTI